MNNTQRHRASQPKPVHYLTAQFKAEKKLKESSNFIIAARELVALKEQFVNKSLSFIASNTLRERILAIALTELATEMGVRLVQPLQINVLGEFTLTALPYEVSSAQFKADMGCGQYGEAFAAILSTAKPRTGCFSPAIVTASNGWCHLNHFAAEQLVISHYKGQAQVDTESVNSEVLAEADEEMDTETSNLAFG